MSDAKHHTYWNMFGETKYFEVYPQGIMTVSKPACYKKHPNCPLKQTELEIKWESLFENASDGWKALSTFMEIWGLPNHIDRQIK